MLLKNGRASKFAGGRQLTGPASPGRRHEAAFTGPLSPGRLHQAEPKQTNGAGVLEPEQAPASACAESTPAASAA